MVKLIETVHLDSIYEFLKCLVLCVQQNERLGEVYLKLKGSVQWLQSFLKFIKILIYPHKRGLILYQMVFAYTIQDVFVTQNSIH